MNKEVIVGIDLGTTNSCVAYVEGKEPLVIENTEGKRITPSIVTFKENKTKPGTYETIVGDAAYRQMLINKLSVRSIKREMGNPNWKITINDNEYNPVDISALILKHIKEFAEKKLGLPIRKAIITIPARFNEIEAKVTKEAANKAGLEVVQLLHEPQAAAIAYGYQKEDDQKKKLLVYDLGGGTFDVTILETDGKDFKELALQGDMHLGGDDWDNRIINWIKDQIKQEYNLEINDPATNQRIKEVAEKAKMELSSANEADISLPFIGMDANNAPINFEAQLTRLQFEEMTKDLFERTKEPVKKALQDANLNITDIDEVILIGGSTRIPAVQSLVREVTGKEPNRTINPDEAVAMGAAILAGVKENKIEEIHLEDITPFSIGLRSNGGHNTIIIPRKSSIPFVKTEICTTSHDLQTRVNIQVLQGEDLDANNNVVLGEFVLDEIEKAKQGIPQIEVTFKLDASGILTVSAKNKKTGKEKEITITNPL